jgi:putative tryptophan/tyrosine transport system substrate-binding protein
MRRRQFIAGLGSAAAWPVAARAQQPTMPVVGYLDPGALEGRRESVAAVRRGLTEAGYVEGRNLAVEYRWAEYHDDRLPALAGDLVRHPVAAIVVFNSTAVAAAKAATKTIPIVFAIGADPVDTGLVASLNRPGGNLTGIYSLVAAAAPKRLELLHELVPAATLIAVLSNPTYRGDELRSAAGTLGVRLLRLNASDPSEFEAAFASVVREGAGGLLLGGDPLFSAHSDQLVAVAARHRVPTMYAWREATAAGGLMSYGTDGPSAWRVVGNYTGRILKGENPADLPVQQVTKMQLAINMKTARALGITFPTALLVRAGEVIE